MGKSLEEYAAQHPQQEPERERQTIAATARTYKDQQQERETVNRLKEIIAQQIEGGSAPQYPLYTALQVIGILTHDEPWTKTQRAALDGVYADLEQQSLLTDTAAEAAHRLDEMQVKYTEKMWKQLQTQLKGCFRLEKALLEARQAVMTVNPTVNPDVIELTKGKRETQDGD